MSHSHLRPGEQQATYTQLADGRWRLVRARSINHGSEIVPGMIPAKGTLDTGPVTGPLAQWAGLRLIDGHTEPGNTNLILVLTYEQIHATDETLAGKVRINRTEDGGIEAIQDWLQFSSARATPQRVNFSVCTVWPVTLEGVVGNATTNTLSVTNGLASGLRDDDLVQLPTLTGGVGLAALTTYYVVNASADTKTWQLSLTKGGAAIDFTTNITAATLLQQVVLVLAREEAPDDGTLRRITRRYVNRDALPAFRGVGLVSYPFASQGDVITARIDQAFSVSAAAYVPAVLDSLYDADANFPTQPDVEDEDLYCIGDSTPVEAEGGMVEYVRSWMNIPATRIVPAGTINQVVPGLVNGGLEGPEVTVTAITPDDGSLPYLEAPVLEAPGHTFTKGDVVLVNLTFTAGQVFKTAKITKVAGDDVTLNGLIQSSGLDIGDFDTGTLRKFLATREPEVVPTTARDVFSHALPGVTPDITVAEDFVEDDDFRPLNALQARTDTLDATTTPTDDVYRAYVKAGDFLTARSGVRRAYGNILEKRTTQFRAK